MASAAAVAVALADARDEEVAYGEHERLGVDDDRAVLLCGGNELREARVGPDVLRIGVSGIEVEARPVVWLRCVALRCAALRCAALLERAFSPLSGRERRSRSQPARIRRRRSGPRRRGAGARPCCPR